MSPLIFQFLLMVSIGVVCAQETVDTSGGVVYGSDGVQVQSPLPSEFVDHNLKKVGSDEIVPVLRTHVVRRLVGGLEGIGKGGSSGECDQASALGELKESAAEALDDDGKKNSISNVKVERLIRAVQMLNASCGEISSISNTLKESNKHLAEKFRRAVEDAAVLGNNKVQSRNLFGGRNSFFNIPLTWPALDTDLECLRMIATPVLGINRAFQLTKALHDLGSTRQEVFDVQEKFMKIPNMTEEEGMAIVSEFENKLSNKLKTQGSITPTKILQNTAQLSGLNSSEVGRFVRAVSGIMGASLNSTEAAGVHEAVRGLPGNELVGLSREVEKVQVGSVTPEGSVGGDWVFSSDKTEDKGTRSLDSIARTFSSERASGFGVEFGRTPVAKEVVFPWVASIQCSTNVFCTGSLISASLILTSGSCVLACGNEPVRVLLGDTRIVTNRLEVNALSAVVHPNYIQSRDPQFDIAVITLANAIDFNLNPLIFPICMVGVETDDPGIECEVVGGQYSGVVLCLLVGLILGVKWGRNSGCGAPCCLCEHGRNCSLENGPWKLIVCVYCGISKIHRKCGNLKSASKYACPGFCERIKEENRKVNCRAAVKKSKQKKKRN